jgi:hypothetical protein
MAEFGLLSGLSADMGYDQRINDARYNALQNERAKAKAASSAALFADEFSQGPIGSTYDDPIISDYVKTKMKEAGNIMKNDPNYKYNPETLAQLKAIKNDIKGNEHVLRATAFVDAKNKLKQDLAEVQKNPNAHDTEAYQELLNQVNNYNQFGNQYGEEAAAKEGAQPFVYQKPKDFIDINKAFSDTGTKFNDLVAGKLKGGGMGSYEEYANPDSLNAVATQMYSQNKRQFDKLAKEQGLNPLEYIKTGINAHIPKKRDFGDYGLAKEKAMFDYKQKIAKIEAGQEHPDANSYQIDIVNKNHSFVSPDQIRELVDSNSPAFLFDNNGKNKINLTGSVTPKQTGYNFYPDPEGKDVTLKGKKYAEAFAYVPVEKATELNILDEDGDVKPEFKDNVTIESKEISGNEKPSKVVKVKLFQPFDVNTSSHAGRFNAKSMTSKQRPLPQENYQINGKPKTVVQNGVTYTLNEQTGNYE